MRTISLALIASLSLLPFHSSAEQRANTISAASLRVSKLDVSDFIGPKQLSAHYLAMAAMKDDPVDEGCDLITMTGSSQKFRCCDPDGNNCHIEVIFAENGVYCWGTWYYVPLSGFAYNGWYCEPS